MSKKAFELKRMLARDLANNHVISSSEKNSEKPKPKWLSRGARIFQLLLNELREKSAAQ
jgi:hypothetical protein